MVLQEQCYNISVAFRFGHLQRGPCAVATISSCFVWVGVVCERHPDAVNVIVLRRDVKRGGAVVRARYVGVSVVI